MSYWIERENGLIHRAYSEIQFENQERLDDDDVELQAYLNPPPPPPPTDDERIDAAFPQTDSAKLIFELFFELVNEVRVLKTQAVLTKAQFKNYIKGKL